MKRFWISWYQPTDDYRPVTVPPKSEVLGYWCSGYRGSDDAATMCAWVVAGSEDEANALISSEKYWPEAEEWRFCNEVEDEWVPSDRFPLDKSGNTDQ